MEENDRLIKENRQQAVHVIVSHGFSVRMYQSFLDRNKAKIEEVMAAAGVGVCACVYVVFFIVFICFYM